MIKRGYTSCASTNTYRLSRIYRNGSSSRRPYTCSVQLCVLEQRQRTIYTQSMGLHCSLDVSHETTATRGSQTNCESRLLSFSDVVPCAVDNGRMITVIRKIRFTSKSNICDVRRRSHGVRARTGSNKWQIVVFKAGSVQFLKKLICVILKRTRQLAWFFFLITCVNFKSDVSLPNCFYFNFFIKSM